MAKSPSVNIIERNINNFATTEADTVVAIVGYATKGPINKATIVTSFKEFRKAFGYPTSLGFSSLAAQRVFNQGNALIFYRVAETEGLEAATPSKVLVKNVIDKMDSYVEFSRTSDILYGAANYTNGEEYDFKLSSKMIYMRSPDSGRWSINDMMNQISSQVPATSGFQEFVYKNLETISIHPYLFKLTLDGSVVAAGTNSNLMVEISATETLDSLAAKIKDAILTGSRAYAFAQFTTAFTSDTYLYTALSLSDSKYNFNVNLTRGGNTFTKIVVSGITPNTTLSQLVDKINTELVRRSIPLVCVPCKTGLYFFQKNAGAIPYAEIKDGDTTEGIIKGTPLFTAAAIAATTFSKVDGINSAVLPSNVSVEVNSYTKRITITSIGSTGTNSTVLLSSAPLISTLTSVYDLTDATFGLGIRTPRNGQASLANSIAVERNAKSKKIRISTIDSPAPLAANFIDNVVIAGGLSFVSLMPLDASVTGHDGTTTQNTDVIAITSKELGSSTANIMLQKSSAVNPVDNSVVNTISIYYDGDLQETFSDVSLKISDDNFFAKKINDSESGSDFVTVETFDNNGDGAITFADGSYQLGTPATDTSVEFTSVMDENDFDAYDYVVGTDGIPVAGGEALFVDALSSSSSLANIDLYNFHILMTPDSNEESVQNAAIGLAESRKDFVYLVDPPFGLSYSEVVDWHNGVGDYGRTAAVSSSYGIIYWPWLKDYDSYYKKYVWVPPSVFMGEKFLEIDKIYKPWYSPAGDSRGKLSSASDVETSPSFAEREQLYGDFNCVNPIVDFYSKGIEIFGQKTALRENQAVNRVNVRRMIIYIKKLIKLALDGMLFEPNNPDSWQRAAGMVNSILERVKQANGIDQYVTIFDSTTNTPDVVAQNYMKGIIQIVPTGMIEFIEITLNIYRSGTVLE